MKNIVIIPGMDPNVKAKLREALDKLAKGIPLARQSRCLH
jgi:hypothetical protein